MKFRFGVLLLLVVVLVGAVLAAPGNEEECHPENGCHPTLSQCEKEQKEACERKETCEKEQKEACERQETREKVCKEGKGRCHH